MGEQEFYDAAKEAFKRILDADIVASDFAQKAGLEDNLKSTRELAKKFEESIPEHFRGVFNLIMCYAYKPFGKMPGTASVCREQAQYFLNRARQYGIEIPNKKQLPG